MMETRKWTYRELLPRERKNGLGSCQVRIETDNPCPHMAVVKIRGVPFCGRCAREQEAYFVIGELTQPRDLDEGLLAKVLEETSWERRRGEAPGACEVRSETFGQGSRQGSCYRGRRASRV